MVPLGVYADPPHPPPTLRVCREKFHLQDQLTAELEHATQLLEVTAASGLVVATATAAAFKYSRQRVT